MIAGSVTDLKPIGTINGRGILIFFEADPSDPNS
jgi:hypothetical protein